jgi:hypothetical protein
MMLFNFSANSYLTLMVKKFMLNKSGKKVTVERGKIIQHNITPFRCPVKSNYTADNALIEDGDDFGFSG